MTTHHNPALPADAADLVSRLHRVASGELSPCVAEEGAEFIATQSAALAAARAENDKLLKLLVEAAQYVRDAGSSSDPETQKISGELLKEISAARVAARVALAEGG